jgi:camelysin-like metallo-endopeptidase
MDRYELADQAAHRRKKRRRALVAILLASSLATLGAGAMSLAVFTDTDATGGSWTAGTIILGVTPAPVFTATNVMPGDSGSQTLTLANTGTGQLRYAMSTATTDSGAGLNSKLQLTIKAGTCAAPGATLYSGNLNGAFLGSNAQGAQLGDRQVNAGSSDSLCFAWSLDLLTTGNAYQGASATATFTFDSEQTANN